MKVKQWYFDNFVWSHARHLNFVNSNYSFCHIIKAVIYHEIKMFCCFLSCFCYNSRVRSPWESLLFQAKIKCWKICQLGLKTNMFCSYFLSKWKLSFLYFIRQRILGQRKWIKDQVFIFKGERWVCVIKMQIARATFELFYSTFCVTASPSGFSLGMSWFSEFFASSCRIANVLVK